MWFGGLHVPSGQGQIGNKTMRKRTRGVRNSFKNLFLKLKKKKKERKEMVEKHQGSDIQREMTSGFEAYGKDL